MKLFQQKAKHFYDGEECHHVIHSDVTSCLCEKTIALCRLYFNFTVSSCTAANASLWKNCFKGLKEKKH